MQNLVAKADVLIEALPYIQRFRGATVVIKFGGSAMEQRTCYDGILTDVVFMECVGINPVIVHGGGSAVTRRLKEAGIRSDFVGGLRVTTEEMIRLVDEVLTEQVNPGIVETLRQHGGRAVGIAGREVLRARRLRPLNPEGTERLDLGLVGEVENVDCRPIDAALADESVPVISPLGRQPDGQVLNINADNAAAEVAIAMRARKLVFLSDVPGVMKDPEDKESFLSTLRVGEVAELTQSGGVAGGMMPKVSAAVRALELGVQKVHIIDGRQPHSLLLEIFTNRGVGTEIVP